MTPAALAISIQAVRYAVAFTAGVVAAWALMLFLLWRQVVRRRRTQSL